MANGYPHRDLFPLKRIRVECTDGTCFDLTDANGLGDAQQYAPTSGYEPLRSWAQAWVMDTLHPACSDVRTTMTCGNFDAMARTLDTLLTPHEDALLVEELAFPYSMHILQPWAASRGVELVAVSLCAEGVDADALDAAAAALRARQRRPKALLTIPTGQNPTTVDASPDAMRRVYAVARAHDLWIVEDDPYHAVHFASDIARPSHLAHDDDGRVVRLDTCSKWLSPGWRVGWLTARTDVVAQIAPLLAFPSTVSQALVHGMLRAWGDKGRQAHLSRIRGMYRSKCERIGELMTQLVPTGILSWTAPSSGMFVWVRVVGGPWATLLGMQGGAQRFIDAAMKAGVTAVPGALFRAEGAPSDGLRLSFAAVSDAEMELGVQRLAALLLSDVG